MSQTSSQVLLNQKKTLLDPDQREEERADLRLRYRQLMKETQENRDDLADFKNDKFLDVLNQQNQLYSHVSHTSEAKLDYQQMELIGDVAVMQMRRTKEMDNATVAVQWFSALKHIFPAKGKGLVDLEELGRSALKMFPPIPRFKSMLGIIQKGDVQRAKSVRTKRVNLDGEFAKPEQVSKRARQLEEKTQTDHRVHQMHKKLIKLDSVNFFEFVVNPDSFSETVENIFDVSFLVRQDSASLVFDERQNTLVIEAAEPLKASEKQESDTKNVQAVMKLTIPIWTQLIEKHNLRERQAPLVGRRN